MSWQPVHLNLRNWLIGFDFQSFRKGKDYKPIEESIICHQLRSGSFIKPDMFIKNHSVRCVSRLIWEQVFALVIVKISKYTQSTCGTFLHLVFMKMQIGFKANSPSNPLQ